MGGRPTAQRRGWSAVQRRQAVAIRAERRRLGWTRRELAERLCLSETGLHTIYQWERGLRHCGWSMLRACSEATLEGAAFAQRILRQLYP